MTGSHNVKVGFQQSQGIYRRLNTANADLYQTYNNGVPLRVTVLNTPVDAQENLDANFGLYAQDSWRIDKLTVNIGLRWDYVKAHVEGQPASFGRFAASEAVRRCLHSNVEGLVAADLGRLRRVRHRQDGHSRGLQQVQPRRDDGVRAAGEPVGAVDVQPSLGGSERRRHRAGRAWVHIPIDQLRDQLR